MVNVHITYSQCSRLELDEINAEMALHPIEDRLRVYDEVLRQGGFFITYDEHFVLIAQALRRRGQIDRLTLTDVCRCRGKHKHRNIEIDAEGDFTSDSLHPFFDQRLRYLR